MQSQHLLYILQMVDVQHWPKVLHPSVLSKEKLLDKKSQIREHPCHATVPYWGGDGTVRGDAYYLNTRYDTVTQSMVQSLLQYGTVVWQGWRSMVQLSVRDITNLVGVNAWLTAVLQLQGTSFQILNVVTFSKIGYYVRNISSPQSCFSLKVHF